MKLFKQGYVHQAIVVDNPEALVQDAEAVVEYLCEEDEEMKQNKLRKI